MIGITKQMTVRAAKRSSPQRTARRLLAAAGRRDALVANHVCPLAPTPLEEGVEEKMRRLMSSIFCLCVK